MTGGGGAGGRSRFGCGKERKWNVCMGCTISPRPSPTQPRRPSRTTTARTPCVAATHPEQSLTTSRSHTCTVSHPMALMAVAGSTDGTGSGS
eukprot:7833223-Prorocentrum_lima.AAC.1